MGNITLVMLVQKGRYNNALEQAGRTKWKENV